MRVAQGGINFSGGQRQRLAIARAVIRRPAIYLFDDAFSALDVHTDARVRAALRETCGGFHCYHCHTADFDRCIEADQVIVVDDGKIVGAGTHESLLADCPTYAEFADSQSVSAGVGARSDGHQRPAPGAAPAPPHAIARLLGFGDPPGETACATTPAELAVITLGITGTAIGVVVPRILGHATDLLFNGVIGRRLPAGITKEQAVAAARARGDNAFADLLSGMNVVPGRGVDFAAVGRTLALALALYLVAALLIWVQARLLNVTVQRTMAALRVRRRGQAAPAAAVLLRRTAARRAAEPGHQRRRQPPVVAVA